MSIKLDDKNQKCNFVGYSEESKAYRVYNPITKKYVISRDVVFKEEEAWDGSIDKLVGEEYVTSHAEDEEDEQGTHGGQLTPRTPTRRTPSRMPGAHEHGEPSNIGGRKGTLSEVSNESNPTLASFKNRLRGHKTRSL